MVQEIEPIHMIKADAWELMDADLELWCDTALSGGLGFWSPTHKKGFAADLPPHAPTTTIYFFEALCVVSTLLWASELPSPPKQLLIHSNSMNTVNALDTLRADDDYNNFLRFAVDILLHSRISLHVYHIPGEENIIADALSRRLWDTARSHAGDISIHLFQPPQDALGASKNDPFLYSFQATCTGSLDP
jgi:hypothetical protein